MSFARAFNPAFLGALTLPVTGLSGLAAFAFLLTFVFSAQFRWLGLLGFAFFSSVCWGSYKVLSGIHGIARNLVEKINKKESLVLSTQHMLGSTGPTIFAFDAHNRKIAVCNTITGDYRIHDFSYLRAWRADKKTRIKNEIGVSGSAISGNKISGPAIHQRHCEFDFCLLLTVADADHPSIKIPLSSTEEAERWSAWLDTMFRG